MANQACQARGKGIGCLNPKKSKMALHAELNVLRVWAL